MIKLKVRITLDLDEASSRQKDLDLSSDDDEFTWLITKVNDAFKNSGTLSGIVYVNLFTTRDVCRRYLMMTSCHPTIYNERFFKIDTRYDSNRQLILYVYKGGKRDS